MHARPPWLIRLLWVLAMALLSSGAVAGEKSGAADKAQQLRQAGETALLAHDFDGAARSLEAAYRLTPTAELLYPLGRLAHAQGRIVEAQDLMRRYLQESAADPAAQQEAQRILKLKAPATGEASVVGERSAFLRVDDRLVGALPLPLPLLLSAGEHRFVIERGALRLEERVTILPGRLAELRCQFHPGFVVVTIAPALLLLSEFQGLRSEQQQRLEQAVGKAAASAHLSVVTRQAALAQAPQLASCLDSRRCQLELATANLLQHVLSLRAQVGAGPSPDWQLQAAVLDAVVGTAAAQAKDECRACTSEQAGELLVRLLEQALKSSLTRPRGKLEVRSEPAGAEVLVQGGVLGVTPLSRPAFVGPLQLSVRHPGYQTHTESVAIAEGQTAQLRIELQAQTQSASSFPAPRPQTQPRPRWRLALGGVALAVGVGTAVLGISALATNDQCVQDAGQPCHDVYSTTGIGAALLTGGALLIAGGSILVALPGARQQVVLSPDSVAPVAPADPERGSLGVGARVGFSL